MKKIIPYLLTFILVVMLVPALAFSNDEALEKPLSPNANVKNPFKLPKTDTETNSDEIVYTVLNHETNEIMQLTPAQYIRGVVAAEMPIAFNKEALSAQAVAAHTYALRQIDAELNNPTPELMGAFLTTDYKKNQAYISDEQLKQKWGSSYAINSKKLDDAINPVIDMIMVVDDKPIIAAFHSLNTGVTESAKNVWGQDVPYLSPVKSQGDELSPNLAADTVLTSAEVKKAVEAVYPDVVFEDDKSVWFNIIESSESNTVLNIKVGSVQCSGKELREILNLKSACFSVSYAEDLFTFSTKGYGHAVGMSQYGADYLARQGSSYIDILKHYYQGVEIVDLKTLQEGIDNE